MWAQRFAMHGAKGHHASLTKDMSMTTLRVPAPGGYDFAARPAVWEVCTSMVRVATGARGAGRSPGPKQ